MIRLLPTKEELEDGEHARACEQHRCAAHQQLGGDQPGVRVHVIEQDRAQPHDRMRKQRNAAKRMVSNAGTGELSHCAAVSWSEVASRSIEATK